MVMSAQLRALLEATQRVISKVKKSFARVLCSAMVEKWVCCAQLLICRYHAMPLSLLTRSNPSLLKEALIKLSQAMALGVPHSLPSIPATPQHGSSRGGQAH